MAKKDEILAKLRAEFAAWNAIFPTLSEAQVTQSRADAITIKDKIAHLWAWLRESDTA